MKNLLVKEVRLFAAPITWIFLAFALMTMIPGYPILLGSFFISMGLFQSFQFGRESNDVLFTVLLPVRKGDAVRGRYLFCALVELIGFGLMAVLTAVRMTLLGNAAVYVTNPLMNATPYFLAWVLVIFALFNGVFVGGFFKTGWKIGKPYILFIILSMVGVLLAETLPHLPGLAFLTVPSGARMGLQLALLAGAAAVYAAVTLISCERSVRRFERLDL